MMKQRNEKPIVTIRRLFALATVLISGLLISGPAFAEKPHRGPHADREIMRMFYPPRAVIKHQAALGLTDKQKKSIKAAIKDSQARAVDAEFELEAELEKLRALVSSTRVDSQRALAQADRIMKLEQGLKRIRLEMLIKTKNVLTPDQQGKLDALKAERRSRRGKRGKRQKRQKRRERLEDLDTVIE